MTTTLDAPSRMGRRQQVLDLLVGVPADLSGQTVELITGGALASTSFVDELLVEVLVRRRADCLMFVDPSEYLQELAVRSAQDLGVTDRILFTLQSVA